MYITRVALSSFSRMRPKFYFPDNYFPIKGQIVTNCDTGDHREGERSRSSSPLFLSLSLSFSLFLPSPFPSFSLSWLRKNRINKRNRRYVEVGLRAIPRVNSTRFSTFAIKGRTYPSADPSTFLYLSRSIPRCLRGRRIDAPTGGFY